MHKQALPQRQTASITKDGDRKAGAAQPRNTPVEGGSTIKLTRGNGCGKDWEKVYK